MSYAERHTLQTIFDSHDHSKKLLGVTHISSPSIAAECHLRLLTSDGGLNP